MLFLSRVVLIKEMELSIVISNDDLTSSFGVTQDKSLVTCNLMSPLNFKVLNLQDLVFSVQDGVDDIIF